jgi:hypothetical protein
MAPSALPSNHRHGAIFCIRFPFRLALPGESGGAHAQAQAYRHNSSRTEAGQIDPAPGGSESVPGYWCAIGCACGQSPALVPECHRADRGDSKRASLRHVEFGKRLSLGTTHPSPPTRPVHSRFRRRFAPRMPLVRCADDSGIHRQPQGNLLPSLASEPAPIGQVQQWQISRHYWSVSPPNTISNTIIAIPRLRRIISNLMTGGINAHDIGLPPHEAVDSSLTNQANRHGSLRPLPGGAGGDSTGPPTVPYVSDALIRCQRQQSFDIA